MSTGAQVNMIKLQLQMILEEIRQEKLNLLARGQTLDMADPRTAVFFRKLEGWQLRLAGLDKQLKQILHRVDSLKGFTHPSSNGLPTDARRQMAYRSKQSLEDQTVQVHQCQDLARTVGRELKELLLRCFNLTAADRWRLMGELGDNVLEFLQNLQNLERAVEQAKYAHWLRAQDSARFRTAIAEVRGQYYIMTKVGAPSPDYVGLATLLVTLLRTLWLIRIRQGR